MKNNWLILALIGAVAVYLFKDKIANFLKPAQPAAPATPDTTPASTTPAASSGSTPPADSGGTSTGSTGNTGSDVRSLIAQIQSSPLPDDGNTTAPSGPKTDTSNKALHTARPVAPQHRAVTKPLRTPPHR